MKIPITMCHGMDEVRSPDKPLTPGTFDTLISIASELGFESIDYDQLDRWRAGHGRLRARRAGRRRSPRVRAAGLAGPSRRRATARRWGRSRPR